MTKNRIQTKNIIHIQANTEGQKRRHTEIQKDTKT